MLDFEKSLKFGIGGMVIEYYELLEQCLGALEQVKSKGWSSFKRELCNY